MGIIIILDMIKLQKYSYTLKIPYCTAGALPSHPKLVIPPLPLPLTKEVMYEGQMPKRSGVGGPLQGYCVFVEGNLVSWKSKKLSFVFQFSAKS